MEESLTRAMMLKLFIRKLRRVLLLSASRGANMSEIRFDEEMEATKMVPDFLSLLEQAKEEYGFQQEGVLAVPCRPEELQKILENRRKRRASTEW
ncbi:hypothetical protein D5086_029401 [Populus alba]|uniref:Uncharacterized protein n=1 Tax=Populus alba TaxID=43335 RepID=A0ACC4AU95_POPAL